MTQQSQLARSIQIPLIFSGLMVAFFVISLMLPEHMRQMMAVIPRQFHTFTGVFLHPLLHFSLYHLISNVIGVMLLGSMICLQSSRLFLRVTLFGWIGGGLLLWLFARSGTMVGGASGVVFAYLGFLMLYGFFARKWAAILVSIATLYFFHGSLWGIFPTHRAISWEGHLAGFLIGASCAYYLGRSQRSKN